MNQWILWAVLGWGLSSAFLMRVIWLPDPPPDRVSKFLIASVAGILGGVAGGWAAANFAASDPMPAHLALGALAGSAIFTAAFGAFSGGGVRGR